MYRKLIICLLLWQIPLLKASNSTSEKITIAFLGSYGDLKVALGAIPLAVELVNNDTTLLRNKRLEFIAADIGTSENADGVERHHSSLATLAIRKMTEMRDNGAAAFIGPDGTCSSEALVAAAWNLPMISYGCADNLVSDKRIYLTFARTHPPSSKVSKSVVSLLKTFNWAKFVLVTGKPAWCNSVTIAIKELSLRNNLTVIEDRQLPDYLPIDVQVMKTIVEDTYRKSRIFVFVGEHLALMDFVDCMRDKNLLDTGEYIIISVDDEIYHPQMDMFKHTIANEKTPFYSFRSVLKLIQSQPQDTRKLKNICNTIKKYSIRDPFNVPYHEKIFDTMSVPVEAAYLYDAVNVYATALTNAIKLGYDIKNGTAILQNILNQTYHSIQGFDVHIDENGDAEGNYSVVSIWNDFDKNNVSNFSMQPIGYFQHSNTDHGLPTFQYFQNKTFQWVGGKVPDAEPACGFDDENCGLKINWQSMTMYTVLAVISIVGSVFGIKHYRYEQKLACLLWKIDIKDIVIIDAPVKDKQIKKINENIVNGTIVDEVIPNNCPLLLAYYKSNLVVMRTIHKRSMDITRTIQKELIQIRELRHENLAQIIGACVDPGNVFILMEYYNRGSLEDVLTNYDIKLDQMFISSLVADILRGMIYLHQSIINVHGNLKSSNCLIDSRWVLRISDFGLDEFNAHQEDPNIKSKLIKRQLYRAPELLSTNSSGLTFRGTQKGDVYSFGILLYEIMGRAGPWGNIDMQEEEIIRRVKCDYQLHGILFRPNTNILQTPGFIIDCMERCWHQEPDQRPEFTVIRELLREMHSGLKPNIFDNMLAMMEKYSYNLEEIVRERTQQLSQEKRRTEELLHEMLPPTVAETLKNGQRVIAESYNCVTIYFSDIVGFTALSAISTPLQVVDLLNELYTTCDSILSQYDVYKVETIGDAYMVVSGLPIRNGNRHAGEIASMALHLLRKVGMFRIKHIPNERLKIRIGIHSGSCVAGVIGVKMPRYCLFGDTVNTASRMEATGKPLQIHISKHTKIHLQQLGGYKFAERGCVYIKGKGEMNTYWLLDEDPAVRENRLQRSQYSEDANYYCSENNFPNETPDLIKPLPHSFLSQDNTANQNEFQRT